MINKKQRLILGSFLLRVNSRSFSKQRLDHLQLKKKGVQPYSQYFLVKKKIVIYWKINRKQVGHSFKSLFFNSSVFLLLVGTK